MDISGLSGTLATVAQNNNKTASADAVNNSLKNISSESTEDELKSVINDF